LSQKNVLLTGASRGIGQAIAERLRQDRSFNLICPSHNELDLASRDSIKRFLKQAPSIDIIINNAGINLLKSLEEIDDESIDKTLSVNLVAPLKLVSGLVGHMKKNNWGRIVNISSIWGLASKEHRALYSMTKFGINGLTKSMAEELGPHGILVNSVCPGYVNTEMTQRNVPEAEQAKIKSTIPLRRFAEPAEIANFIRFLISEENTYITGQLLLIDGGFL